MPTTVEAGIADDDVWPPSSLRQLLFEQLCRAAQTVERVLDLRARVRASPRGSRPRGRACLVACQAQVSISLGKLDEKAHRRARCRAVAPPRQSTVIVRAPGSNSFNATGGKRVAAGVAVCLERVFTMQALREQTGRAVGRPIFAAHPEQHFARRVDRRGVAPSKVSTVW